MIDRQKRIELIHAMSMDGNNRQRIIMVPRSMVGGNAWKIHKMKEVPDPNPEPVKLPHIAVAAPVTYAEPEATEAEQPRGPGRPRKTQP